MKYLICPLLFLTVLFPARRLNAQPTGKGLWDQVKDSPAKLTRGAGKTTGKIKKFKDHLQRWGLDSNYNHGMAVGARLNSTGWTGLVCYQRRISRTQSHFFQLSLSEVKHEKQVKQQRDNTAFPELGPGSPFIFGKINHAYLLQLGHGREFLLLPGVLDGNLSISLRFHAGVSLAMLKPDYLKLVYEEYNPHRTVLMKEEKYSGANSEKYLNPGYIVGASKWKKGINELKYLPGGYADAAIVIEPLKNKSFIKTVTLGGNFSMHSGNLEIMADQKTYPWVASVYAGLSFGKRWK